MTSRKSEEGYEERFRDWLETAIEERGIGQRQIATWAGLDHSIVSKLLSGKSHPSFVTALRLGRVLGTQSMMKALMEEQEL